jgi:hypothetical protein
MFVSDSRKIRQDWVIWLELAEIRVGYINLKRRLCLFLNI